MKTEYNHSRRTLWVSSGFFLALLVGNSPHLYAEERRADSSLVEPIINGNEQPMEPGNTRDAIRPVGPSGEEIHDFLYPTAKDGKVVTLTQLGGARESSEQLSPMVARTDSGCAQCFDRAANNFWAPAGGCTLPARISLASTGSP
jgi:hypothetical protein